MHEGDASMFLKPTLLRRIGVEQRGLLFISSAFLFRVGLFTMTFEEMRPLDILLADYFLFASLFLLLCSQERRLLLARGSGVLASSAVILCGALLTGIMTPAGVRIVILFGLFAPLAVAHAKDIRRNLRFLVAGATINCVIAIMGSVSGEIVSMLTVNPRVPDLAQELGRATGLAGHPNSLGVSAALGVLIAVGLLQYEDLPLRRAALFVAIPICTIGAILSGSRTFVVAAGPALLVLTLWRKWNRRFVLRLGIGVVGLFVVWMSINYLFVDSTTSYLERLSKTDAEDYENSVRLAMAAVAIAEISQEPVAGWGLAHFGEAGMIYVPDAGDFLPAHVNFLNYWYAEGILGAIGYALLFVLPVKRMLQTLKKGCPDNLAHGLRLGICVYLLLFIVSNLAPLLLNRLFYLPLFLFAGLAASIPDPSSVPCQSLPQSARTLGHANSQGV